MSCTVLAHELGSEKGVFVKHLAGEEAKLRLLLSFMSITSLANESPQ
jgi:hypothetical protein